MDWAAWFRTLAPRAQDVYRRTGWLPSVQLAQLAVESGIGYGELSELATRCHNLGGIKYTGLVPSTRTRAGFACYPDEETFWRDYERVQRLSIYREIPAAGPDSAAQVRALARSPYAEGGYGGGANLLDVIRRYRLTRYDQVPGPALPAPRAAPVPAPSPAPAPAPAVYGVVSWVLPAAAVLVSLALMWVGVAQLQEAS